MARNTVDDRLQQLRYHRDAKRDEFGIFLRKRRKEVLHLTREQMAYIIGVDANTVWRWETGQAFPNNYSAVEALIEGYKLNEQGANRARELAFGSAIIGRNTLIPTPIPQEILNRLGIEKLDLQALLGRVIVIGIGDPKELARALYAYSRVIDDIMSDHYDYFLVDTAWKLGFLSANYHEYFLNGELVEYLMETDKGSSCDVLERYGCYHSREKQILPELVMPHYVCEYLPCSSGKKLGFDYKRYWWHTEFRIRNG